MPSGGSKENVRPIDVIKDQIFVFSLAEGFFQTSVLLALLQLDLFDRIGTGTESDEVLATELGASAETLERLLNAGVMLRLLDLEGREYRLTEPSRSVLLSSAGEAYVGDWLRNMDMFREAFSRLDEAVLTSGPTVDSGAHIGTSPEETRDFALAMHNYAIIRGRELAEFLDTAPAASLLDVGCGPGTYAFHIGERNPDLDLYLLDHPGVLDVAREVEATYRLSNSIEYLPVDVTTEPIPGEYDVVLVSNTLHMLGERHSRSLLSKLYDNVAPGGSLVIQAQFLRNDRIGGRWPVFIDLLQLVITEEGRNHTEAETREWMTAAGFDDIKFVPMSLFNTNSFLRGFKR